MPRPHWIPTNDTIFGLVGLLVILGVAASYWIWNGRVPGAGSAELETCRALYSKALTNADTLNVDQMRSRQSKRAEPTCGAMRSAGSLQRVAR